LGKSELDPILRGASITIKKLNIYPENQTIQFEKGEPIGIEIEGKIVAIGITLSSSKELSNSTHLQLIDVFHIKSNKLHIEAY